MKNISAPKVIAYISCTAGILVLAGFLVSFWFPQNIFAWLIYTFVSVLLIFLLSKTLVNSFIYNKIRILYKAIHDTQKSSSELKEKGENIDVLAVAEKEVEDWSKERGSLVAQLKQQEKYRKEFIGNVSHELKTPIFNIQGYILTLLDGGLEDPTINRPFLERSEKSINRMITIVKDLETISKLESGELKLIKERFNINDLILEVMEMQEMRAKKHGITLKYTPVNHKSNYVHADKKEIFQVMNNLLVNSIKYGKDDGTTRIEVMDMENKLLVEVKDNGLGIEADNLPRIFERFFRVDKSRARNMGGSGLGLAIVKHIIDAHEQNINVRSTFGEGTSFAFTLEKSKK